jgi:hypothetical protein
MKDLNTIKDEVAKSNGYPTWYKMLIGLSDGECPVQFVSECEDEVNEIFASQFKASSQLPSGLEKPDFEVLAIEESGQKCHKGEHTYRCGCADIQRGMERIWRDYVSSPTAKREDVEELLEVLREADRCILEILAYGDSKVARENLSYARKKVKPVLQKHSLPLSKNT